MWLKCNLFRLFRGCFKDLSFLHKINMGEPSVGSCHPSEIRPAYSECSTHILKNLNGRRPGGELPPMVIRESSWRLEMHMRSELKIVP
jgi:hypothetical protein